MRTEETPEKESSTEANAASAPVTSTAVVVTETGEEVEATVTEQTNAEVRFLFVSLFLCLFQNGCSSFRFLLSF